MQRPRPHQHRTLQFSASTSQNTSADDPASRSSGWVTRNDRHRQLINANVFEKQSQNRAKAIERTRKQKENEKRRGEKTRLKEFLRHQQAAVGAPVKANTPTARNELVIDGIRFQVLDGGKKLARVAGKSGRG